jgi:hypothetical protein
MSLDASRYRLFREFEALRERWQQTQVMWQDVVRQEFAQEHWQHLDAAVLGALAAMDRLAPIVTQVRQDCAGREFF